MRRALFGSSDAPLDFGPRMGAGRPCPYSVPDLAGWGGLGTWLKNYAIGSLAIIMRASMTSQMDRASPPL